MKNKEGKLLIKISGNEFSGNLILEKSKAERLVRNIIKDRRKNYSNIRGMLVFEFQNLAS